MCEVAPKYSLRDSIQLTELAVRDRMPPYANEDDMYLALDKCGMTVGEIFEEVDRHCPGNRSDRYVSDIVVQLLFARFDQRVLEVTAHKSPL
jgi:hypothetical protein